MLGWSPNHCFIISARLTKASTEASIAAVKIAFWNSGKSQHSKVAASLFNQTVNFLL
jgi:hypothetical protein